MTYQPLVPHSPGEARALFSLLHGHLCEQVAADENALAHVALECVAHLSGLGERRPPLPRTLVLHGREAVALAAIATAAADGMALPRARVTLNAMSEVGWHGNDLADALDPLARGASPYDPHGVITLVGLDALRIEQSLYHSASGTTRDYKQGKAANVASLLRGDLVAGERHDGYDATWAMVIVTCPELPEHDTDALVDWGLTYDLASALSSATWIHVPRAIARVAEREIIAHLEPVVRLHAAMGCQLEISPEAVRWAARAAEERDESASAAASWIAAPLRARLIEMLSADVAPDNLVVGPDSVAVPPPSRGTWHD